MAQQPKLARKEEEIIERTSPPGEVIYYAIHSEGEHELKRGSSGLAWSGLAAGLSMGFSLITQAFLQAYLPSAPWRPLLDNLGYTIGFVIVILGRQQLFTENTLTAVLPLLTDTKASVFLNVLRLWGIVLVTNLAGSYAFAWLLAHTSVVDGDVRRACANIGREAMQFGFMTTMLRSVIAGWLIALMVWLLPFAESARVSVIIIISYLVGVGHFSHIIAGSVKAFYLVASAEVTFGHTFFAFLVPTLLGNVVGGVTLVAGMGHAQFIAQGRSKI